MPERKLSPFHRNHKVEVKKPPAALDSKTSEELWSTALRAISQGDTYTAVQAHDAMPRQDYIWHLSSANDIAEAIDPVDEIAVKEAQQRIIEDAINLTVSRIGPGQLSGLDINQSHYDDTDSLEHPPEIRDVILLGRSWDNTNRDPLMAEFFVRMVEAVNSKATDELADSFYAAHQDETLSFHRACLNRFAKYNEFSLHQAGQMVAPRAQSPIAPHDNIPTVDEVIDGAKLTARAKRETRRYKLVRPLVSRR